VTVADTLALWGIQRAPEVVELAAASGLNLAVACALLEQESGGGWNVWGNDGVNTGNAYLKGSTVTQSAYEVYRALRRAGQIGNQGVGPCQLTATGFQDQADQLGGCWDWRCNVRVGFGALAGLMRTYGNDGIRRYNGSGPDAQIYLQQMLAKTAAWTARIGPSNLAPAVLPAPAPRPVPVVEDDLMASIVITPDPSGRFHESVGAEAGGGSAIATSGWVTFGSTYGGTTWTVAALGVDGAILGYWPGVRTNNNTQTARQLPDGTRAVTVEGQRDNDGTRPWASAWSLR
jgi:hypothetical protein